MSDFMRSDKILDRDLNRCKTPDEIRDLLFNSIERSTELGVTRDPVTGQFVSRTPQQRSPQEHEEPREFRKVVTIAGTDFEFTSDSLENLEVQIRAAQSVAEQLRQPDPQAQQRAEAEQEAAETARRTNLELQFRRGEITTAEFLEQSGAIGEYLQNQGVSIDKLREDAQQKVDGEYVKDWESAGQAFLAQSDWPGGQKNLALIRQYIVAMGLGDAENKVEALRQAYEAMKKDGVVFDREVTEQDVLRATDKMSPEEILETYKQSLNVPGGDTTAANSQFIETFRQGRSSGLFGK